nr:serine hydrolase domain-containing protein [Kribbella sp. VKM Ac-2527]
MVPDPDGPGVVVGLVGPDGALTSAARGLAALEHRVPIGERTVFHLASVSKQFTAEAVQVLIRAGKVGADDRVAEYLPWLPFPEITVEQLARHSSGLRDQWQLVEASGRRMEDVITTADLVELIRRQTSLQFEPGSWHAYSNTNYTLLALLVEAVSGETLDDFCRAQLFAPLGMDDTLFVADHRKVVPRRAWSYRRIPSGYERIVLSYGTAGASSLHSTITDLARWAAAVRSRDSWQSPLPSTPYAGTASYGWGIRHGRYADSLMLWHAGADAGFRTHLAMLPEPGWSAIVLGSFAELDPDQLARAALALVFPSPTPTHTPLPSATVPSGTYLDLSRGMVVDVESTDAGLRLDAGMGPTLLAPVGDGRFADGYAVAEFDGEQLLVSEDPALHPHQWIAIEPPAAPLALDRFVGEFYSTELSASFRVIRSDNGLVLDRPRHGRHRMQVVGDGVFRVRSNDGDESGLITLTFDQAGVVLGYSTFSARSLTFRRMGVADGTVCEAADRLGIS